MGEGERGGGGEWIKQPRMKPQEGIMENGTYVTLAKHYSRAPSRNIKSVKNIFTIVGV